jgi:hypothetical protein
VKRIPLTKSALCVAFIAASGCTSTTGPWRVSTEYASYYARNIVDDGHARMSDDPCNGIMEVTRPVPPDAKVERVPEAVLVAAMERARQRAVMEASVDPPSYVSPPPATSAKPEPLQWKTWPAGDFEVRISRVWRTWRLDHQDLSSSGAHSPNRSDPDGRYVLVEMSVTNILNRPRRRPELTLTSSLGSVNAQSTAGPLAKDSYYQLDPLLNPQSPSHFVAVFDVGPGPRYRLHLDGEGSIPLDAE